MSLEFLGVDTGGTFTDFIYFGGDEIRIHKVLSTPDAPERAILQGIAELGLENRELRLVHGSTVATNAVLEGKGVATAYVTNRGFADVLAIGRQARRELYNLSPRPTAPLIDASLCFEIDTRLTAQGECLKQPDETELHELLDKLRAVSPEAVAINLLFSFLDAQQEQLIAEQLKNEPWFVTCSSDVLAEYREYERGVATVLNAMVGPLMQGYLNRLAAGVKGGHVAVMQSSATTVAARDAATRGVHLLLSGPAGGLRGAQYVAGLSGRARLMSFDMGGTSTDVALMDGDIRLTSEGRIGDYPVAVPMVDMHTIGAGGGSIARVDAGGLLLVGPQSAGAAPGPACYARGGNAATVTDANLVLGRLQADAFLGGRMQLDVEAARRVIEPLAVALNVSIEDAALGIVQVANEHMVQALRVISVQRGEDPRDYTLVSFGGAGGLHVCALANALGMNRAMVPVHGGVLSALGMLAARPGRELSRTITRRLSQCQQAELQSMFDELEQQGRNQLQAETDASQIECQASIDARYTGQSFTLNLAWQGVAQLADQFHEMHRQRYGHALDMEVEIVNLRISLQGAKSGFVLPEITAGDDELKPVKQVWLHGYDSPVTMYQRDSIAVGVTIEGPALIVELVSTTYLESDWRCGCDAYGNLLLEKISG